MLDKMLIANYVDHQTLSLYSPEKVNWENKTQYFRLREAFIKKKEKKMTFVILGGGQTRDDKSKSNVIFFFNEGFP